MNSIILTHVAAPAQGAFILDDALDHLGAWVDTERDMLGRVLAQAGQRQTNGALEALDQLHLAPQGDETALRDLLEEARTWLEVLLETLRAIPSHCQLETAWGLPGPAPFDAHLRWSGARLTDILTVLDRALAARY